MKANDLRLGNWIKIISLDVETQVKGIELEDKFYSIDTQYQFHGWMKNVEPIPLTEEWLMKFGFKKHKTDDRYITFAKANININDGIVNLVGYPNFLNHIKHVHQLQNIYHALTGKEL